MKEIKYIGFYDCSVSSNKRYAALSAMSKMDYIMGSIIKADFKVHLITPSWIDDKNSHLKNVKNGFLEENNKIRYTVVPSFKTKIKIFRYLKIRFSLIWLFFLLIFKTKRNEKILVYHSQILIVPVMIAKFIKGFKLVYEVEEIYSDVANTNSYWNYLEYQIFKKVDFFLFSTELLANKIGVTKNYLVVYGNYNVSELITTPSSNDIIHLVYAGIIDFQKAGAFNAVESAVYLPENYCIHIIGFGEVEKLQLRIDEINKISKCKVSYDGIKNGKEYIKFCQSCHIGLSTQKMKGDYLESSFPSKILSYLGMGLRVVSCYVACVAESKISKLVSYYKVDDPESIAGAILAIDLLKKNVNSQIIRELDEEFVRDLKQNLS